MLSEEEVYNGAKNWLVANDYKVIAGQPARGVDHLPVIEIKTGTTAKGSKESYKPDLLALRDDSLFIIECKPGFDISDYNKILSILDSEVRIANLYQELEQYSLIRRFGIKKNHRVKGILAYSGALDTTHSKVSHMIVKKWTGDAELFD